MKIQVTFITKTGHQVVEVMDSANGSTCDYNLRACALGWTIKEVVNIG